MSDVSHFEGSWLLEEIFLAPGDEDRDGQVSSDREPREKKLSNEGEDDCLQFLEEWAFLGGKDSGSSFLGFVWFFLFHNNQPISVVLYASQI